jgi:hypothetical protein
MRRIPSCGLPRLPIAVKSLQYPLENLLTIHRFTALRLGRTSFQFSLEHLKVRFVTLMKFEQHEGFAQCLISRTVASSPEAFVKKPLSFGA